MFAPAWISIGKSKLDFLGHQYALLVASSFRPFEEGKRLALLYKVNYKTLIMILRLIPHASHHAGVTL